MLVSCANNLIFKFYVINFLAWIHTYYKLSRISLALLNPVLPLLKTGTLVF
jgi:hypothetical protein